MRGWSTVGLVLGCLSLGGSSCDRGAIAEAPVVLAEKGAGKARPAEGQAAQSTQKPRPDVDTEGLLIGEFRLASNPVVDGDTIRVEGVDGSIRLLFLDTEEKIRSPADREAIQRDFFAYLRHERGGAARPTKPATPMGDEATAFAERFFEGVEVVRLERDDPKKLRGLHGRLLGYVFVEKNDRWTSYNVECVRAGMSPYFTKYGYSRRFHKELALAEAEAREAHRGIWSQEAQAYGDYDERKAWWNARADFIRAFEHEASRRNDFIELADYDAEGRLEAKLGHSVAVLGTVGRIDVFKGLARVYLQGHQEGRFPLIFRDREMFRRSEIARYKGEPISVSGTVERYEKGSYRTLQIEVRKSKQLSLPRLPWPKDETDSAAVR